MCVCICITLLFGLTTTILGELSESFQRAFEDCQLWAATDRVRQTVGGERCCDGEGAVLRPLLYVAGSPARWDRPMTPSAGDAVIPHSRPGRWRSAGSSVRTRVRTGKPVRTLLGRQLPRSPSRIIMPRQYWRKLFVDFFTGDFSVRAQSDEFERAHRYTLPVCTSRVHGLWTWVECTSRGDHYGIRG